MPWKSQTTQQGRSVNSNPQRMRRGQGGKLSGQIAPTPADTLATCRPGPSGEEGQAQSYLGKPVAASPLLVQAIVQEPLANGLGDFN